MVVDGGSRWLASAPNREPSGKERTNAPIHTVYTVRWLIQRARHMHPSMYHSPFKFAAQSSACRARCSPSPLNVMWRTAHTAYRELRARHDPQAAAYPVTLPSAAPHAAARALTLIVFSPFIHAVHRHTRPSLCTTNCEATYQASWTREYSTS